MNTCKYCGLSIVENKKYCNRSCSGKATSANARKALAEKTKNDPDWSSRRSRALWDDPDYQKKVKEKTFDSPEWKAKYQSAENQTYAIDGYKKKLQEDEEFRNQENEKRQRVGLRAHWQNPEFRESFTERNSLRAVKQNRDPNSKFGTRCGNWTEYKNIKMRSSWEAKFASQLDDLSIQWEYEPTTFVLSSGKRYTPDFFLPEYSLYIEIKPRYFVTESIQETLDTFPYSIKLVTQDNWDEFIQSLSRSEE